MHGNAPDIKGENIANPNALLLSAVMMLKYINNHDIAQKIENALFEVLKEGKILTHNLGGNSTTTEFTDAIINKL